MKYAYFFVFFFLFRFTTFAQKTEWAGFYAGLNTGVSFNDLSIGKGSSTAIFQQITNVNVPGRGIVIVPGTSRPVPVGSSDKATFTGGIQLGYLKQFKQWAAGIEADVNYLSAKVQSDNDDILGATVLQEASPYGIHHSASTHFTESINAKIGYVRNQSLIYLTAGPIFTNLKTTAADYYNSVYWASAGTPPNNHPTSAQVRFVNSNNNENTDIFTVGYTLGLGYQWVISKNKSLNIAYQYSDMNKSYTTHVTVFDATPIDSRTTYAGVIDPIEEKVKIKTSQVIVRLNMALNWPKIRNK